MQQVSRAQMDHEGLHYRVQFLAPNQPKVIILSYLTFSWTYFSLALNSQFQKWAHS